MPGDAVHVKSAKYVAFFGAIVLYTCGLSLIYTIAAVLIFMFGVMFLSPDLDLPSTAPIKRWGILSFCWLPFEKRIDHRSKWSHGWILGAITIQLYFLVILAVIIAFLRLCWLPLFEPLIAQGNQLVDGLLALQFSTGVLAGFLFIECCLYAAHVHHKTLDTFLKNR